MTCRILLNDFTNLNHELIEFVLYKSTICEKVDIIPIILNQNDSFKIRLNVRKLCLEFNGMEHINIKFIDNLFFDLLWDVKFKEYYNNVDCLTVIIGNKNEIQQISIHHKMYLVGDIQYKEINNYLVKYDVKKVILSGVESSGKTTLSNMLAKKYKTTNTYEYGRDYAMKFFNGNDDAYDLEDFFNIAFYQRQLEKKSLKNAEIVAFFDTDIIITQFYCEIMCGKPDIGIEYLIDLTSYDLILFLEPDLVWVKDNVRFMNDLEKRKEYAYKLYEMYCRYGYDKKIVKINGNYEERYSRCIDIIDLELLNR